MLILHNERTFGEFMMGTKIVDNRTLPEQWIRAYERDTEGQADYADPAWERKAARVLAAFILSGLFFLALPGTFLGVWNLVIISSHRSHTAASAAWIQAHGHARLLGWVGSFILGISLYILPKFRGRPLKTFEGLSRIAPIMRRESLGPYATVARNACESCHVMHNAPGKNPLLNGVSDETCLNCHDGSSNISPPLPNILAEMTPPKHGHEYSAGNSPHRPHEPVLLNQGLHVTCVDCHNPHASQRVTDFSAAPTVRPSQAGVAGISAKDGKTVVSPAVNQYEICLRCHGTSTGKKASINFSYQPRRVVSAPDPLNVIPEFNSLATSSHPVFQDRRSMLPQPSLRPYMLNLDGNTPGRPMGNRILCTDCHNSDDNREFGGKGPNGPHGSIFPHILERRYEFSTAPAPGRPVTNLFPNPNLSAAGGENGGPYALCAKCTISPGL